MRELDVPYENKQNRVTLDMLRAFVCLAQTLNLSEASGMLRITRQTLRRHITELEAIRGDQLLKLEAGRYTLTGFGRDCLSEAEEVLRLCGNWDKRTGGYRVQKLRGFEHAEYHGPDGQDFYCQQHSIGTVGQNGLPLLREMLSAWGQAGAQIEAPAMARIRPYIVIYRKSQQGWICTEVGEKSAYARWFGWNWAKSAQGVLSEEDHAGDEFNRFIYRAYSKIYDEGGIRLDHLHAYLPREGYDKPEPLSFQRILAGCHFPDGQQALAVLVAMTNNISIKSLETMQIPEVSQDLLMEHDLEE